MLGVICLKGNPTTAFYPVGTFVAVFEDHLQNKRKPRTHDNRWSRTSTKSSDIELATELRESYPETARRFMRNFFDSRKRVVPRHPELKLCLLSMLNMLVNSRQNQLFLFCARLSEKNWTKHRTHFEHRRRPSNSDLKLLLSLISSQRSRFRGASTRVLLSTSRMIDTRGKTRIASGWNTRIKSINYTTGLKITRAKFLFHAPDPMRNPLIFILFCDKRVWYSPPWGVDCLEKKNTRQ